MKRTARRRFVAAVVGMCAIGAALGLVVLPAISTASASPDDAQIRGVIVRAAHLLQEESGMLPPGAYRGGQMPQSVRDQMTANSMSAAARVFKGRALDVFAGIVKDNIDEQASGEIRHMAAGVSRVDITSLRIDGDQANVDATLDVWAEFGQVHADGSIGMAHPKSQTVDKFLLQRIDGTWYVIDHVAHFANGSGP
jgi:hypothetical protein